MVNVIAVPEACQPTICTLFTEQSNATVWAPVAGVYVLPTSVVQALITLPVIVPQALDSNEATVAPQSLMILPVVESKTAILSPVADVGQVTNPDISV